MASGGNGTVNFDVVTVATDHHFLRSNRTHFQNCNSPVYRAVMKEWKSLAKDLPESIYVHAYETRIDLLRAVIVGSPGTPYHNGLFFFDISLPKDYPHSPPKVHYRSHGYRLNPNLYADGTVCLSLINTWIGAREEKWTRDSTILQTLVSIQGLVLNERPYFNEPYYARDKNSRSPAVIKRSIKYNQTAFVLSCKTMLAIARNPPRNFEGFVREHVRARAGLILASVWEYEQRVREVGWFGTHAASTRKPATSGWKTRQVQADLAKIRSELLIAFSPVLSPETRKIYGGDDAKKVARKKKGILSKLIGCVC